MPGMSGDKKKRPWWHWALASAGTIAFIVLLIWGPWWIEGHHLRDDKGDLYSSAGIIVTGFRTMLVAIAAGGFTAAGLWYTHKKHELEADSQVTDRYVEAVKLLGSENLHERLGGIYSLERIMKDSDRDHPTIVEVLSSFVRTKLVEESENAERADAEPLLTEEAPRKKRHATGAPLSLSHRLVPVSPHRKFSEEVKAALTVLNRRSVVARFSNRVDLTGADLGNYDLAGQELRYCILRSADLLGADLTGALFEWADLTGATLNTARMWGTFLDEANLDRARLDEAILAGASIQRASLRQAWLGSADLTGASMQGANLMEANLGYANLRGASLENVNLEGANLGDANLDGANLESARGLTAGQVSGAYLYKSTKLPGDLARHRNVRLRITECEGSRPPAHRATSAGESSSGSE